MASNDDLLFAEHAVQAGFLTQDQVAEGLDVQGRMAEMGVVDALRHVLVKKGFLREGDAALVAKRAGLESGREPIPGYTLLKRLGTGAMGSVYKAYQKGMKRHVAVKILRRDLTDDPRQVDRLRREAELIGKLDHPNIVRGLDSGQSGGLVWFVMDYVEGKTLREHVREEGTLDVDEALAITTQMASALAHAHSHRIVHRDIKPGNILIATDGMPRLTDYGLAKGETDDALTQIDATLGTPQYISPEQARNPRDADVRSDIYSLGATLYAMLTGRPPFTGDTVAEILTKVLYERPESLAEAVPGTPEPVVYLVERMMAKDRRHRYASPAELLRDLGALESGKLHVPTGFRGDIEQFEEARLKRNRLLRVAAFAAVGVLVAFGTWAVESRSEERRLERDAVEQLHELERATGPEIDWDGGTVRRMTRRVGAFLDEYGETSSAPRAREFEAQWKRQERALRRAQEIVGDADEEAVDWPRAIRAARAGLRDLEGDPDTSVAQRRLTRHLVELRERRDRRATEEIENRHAATAKLPLWQAAQEYEQLEARLESRYFGGDESPLLTEAGRAARQFRLAAETVDAHFQDYETFRDANGGLTGGEFYKLRTRLNDVEERATADPELRSLLASLPPQDSRSVALVSARAAALREALEKASRDRWAEVRARVQKLEAARDFEAARTALESFAVRALPREAAEAETLATTIDASHKSQLDGLRTRVELAAQHFFHNVGEKLYALARKDLDDLAAAVAEWKDGRDEGAAALVGGGRRLLDLIDERAWGALRKRLQSGAALERGLKFGEKGTVFSPDSVSVKGELVVLVQNGQEFERRLDQLVLEQVLDYSGLTRATDADGSLAYAAMRVTGYRMTDREVRKTEEALRGAILALDRARSDPSLARIADRLSARAGDIVATARARVLAEETNAESEHRSAGQKLKQGSFQEAHDILAKLLKAWSRTDYVREHRVELEQELQRARNGLNVGSFGQHLPGGELVKYEDGVSVLTYDFDRPGVADELELDPAHHEVRIRRLVKADLAGGGSDGGGLLQDRVFAWLPWTAVPDSHPKHYPLELMCPFQYRERIELSFRYSSESPLFLLFSIGGTTAGVLSADDQREGGRGVAIWQTQDLSFPEEGFSDRHRAHYLESHPELLEREGDTTYFRFEPGSVYRVRFVKDRRKASLHVNGRLLLTADIGAKPGALDGTVVLMSYTSGEVDDVRISGILDQDWLDRKERERR